MQVMRIKAATMTWRQWHLNWYHGVGESIFEIYSAACTYLDYCGSQRNSSELTPIFIEKPGDEETWEEALPPAASALKCLYPTQAWWIKDQAIQDKVSCSVYWTQFTSLTIAVRTHVNVSCMYSEASAVSTCS